ncbi:magnesium-dependent phosphatase 1 [Olea europaea subsp. europaea]|uniref:Magnesium-dependent phosphatase 1 n=1 Tax=Olea europaea subsp. europaea TaxID=158383 RepID=A0A8S0V1N6_OLEEU|nr:magnesium-dependent phosphatase 1 [Olea europaea subsp. europaea]
MSNDEAEQIIGLHGTLPRLVVFDLDYTLWPFYCDLFHEDHAPDPYPHALGILHALKARGIDMAIASRSRTPEIARLFLEKLGVRSMFVAEVSKMGVTSILVRRGVTLDSLRQGLSDFEQKSTG